MESSELGPLWRRSLKSSRSIPLRSKQGKAVRGNPSIRSTYDGVTYFFASKADKADFDKSLEKFKPQYGGFCANSISKGRRNDIDPKVFRVYKDKLYVCTTPADLKEFSANLDTNISKADKNWLQIRPSTYNSETRGFDVWAGS